MERDAAAGCGADRRPPRPARRAGVRGRGPGTQDDAQSLPTGVTASPGAVYTYNQSADSLSLTSGVLTFNSMSAAPPA